MPINFRTLCPGAISFFRIRYLPNYRGYLCLLVVYNFFFTASRYVYFGPLSTTILPMIYFVCNKILIKISIDTPTVLNYKSHKCSKQISRGVYQSCLCLPGCFLLVISHLSTQKKIQSQDRIPARYQACHVTYKLKICSMNFRSIIGRTDQSQNGKPWSKFQADRSCNKPNTLQGF